jgi:predicted esterase
MTTTPGTPLLRHAPATVHGRYLVLPLREGGRERWLVGFHGYAQGAEAFVGPLARMAGGGAWRAISVQALHPFYARRSEEVVANWMTRQDRELAIVDNVAYVDAVLDQLEREFGAPSAIVYAGFSQGVAMAYRAALRGRRDAAAIVTGGGDVPPELAEAGSRRWPRVLAATGSGDEWYSPERLRAEVAALRARGADARALVFEGGHEWSPALEAAAAELLRELAAT